MLVLFSNHVSSITCCYGQDNTTPSFIRSDNNDHKDRMKKGDRPYKHYSIVFLSINITLVFILLHRSYAIVRYFN